MRGMITGKGAGWTGLIEGGNPLPLLPIVVIPRSTEESLETSPYSQTSCSYVYRLRDSSLGRFAARLGLTTVRDPGIKTLSCNSFRMTNWPFPFSLSFEATRTSLETNDPQMTFGTCRQQFLD